MATPAPGNLGLGNPHGAASLLAHRFKCAPDMNRAPFPTLDHRRKERLDTLLNSDKGRDFTIKTVSGVVFKIHSVMLIGQAKKLEQVAYPGYGSSGEKGMYLTEKCHPFFIDRMVCFIYTSRYSVDANNANDKIGSLSYHHSLPPNATCTSFELSMNYTQFQVAMYGMGEDFQYPQLMSYAFGRIVQYFLHEKKDQERIKQLIKIVFEPAWSSGRLCKDEVGALKGLAIAAVLVHEKLHWSGAEMDHFRDLLAEELDLGMWKEYRTCYKQTKDMNADLIKDTESGMASLTSAMGKVDLDAKQPGKAPTFVETLHLLFDEHAFWSLKALRAKTGQSNDVLYKALHKIAQQVKQAPYVGLWQRKSTFKRSSKCPFPDPNGGHAPSTELPKEPQGHAHTTVPSSPRIRAHDSPQSNSQMRAPNMGMRADNDLSTDTPIHSAPKSPDFFGTHNGPVTTNVPSDRKIAVPGGRFSFKSPTPTSIIADAHQNTTSVDCDKTPNTGHRASKRALKASQTIDQATLFSSSYGKRFISNLTPTQMQALEDIGISRKTPKHIRKMPEQTKKTRERTKISPEQTRAVTPAQTMASPTAGTFGGVAASRMNFNTAPMLPSSFSFGGPKGFQGQDQGAAENGSAGIGMKFYDPERNKENIPWSGSEDDEETEEDEVTGGHRDSSMVWDLSGTWMGHQHD